MEKLSTNPVLIRELEVRSRYPGTYAGCRYEGPILPLFLVGTLMILASSILGTMENWPLNIVQIPVWLYVLYLAYGASRLGGGSLAMDWSFIRSLPMSGLDIFVGKLIGTLLPFWVEVLLAAPLLLLMCFLAHVPLTTFALLVVFLFGTVLWYGMWGMCWSAAIEHATPAVAIARRTTHFMIWGTLAIYLVLRYFQLEQEGSCVLAAFNPLYMVKILLDPASAAPVLTTGPFLASYLCGAGVVPMGLACYILQRLEAK